VGDTFRQLWKENLNSDCQQFHQCQQNYELSHPKFPQTSEHTQNKDYDMVIARDKHKKWHL
jgi:hypothetical protein